MYILTHYTETYLPETEPLELETLAEAIDAARDLIKSYIDDCDDNAVYFHWEVLSRLRKSHLIHAGVYGIVLGIIQKDSTRLVTVINLSYTKD